MGATKARKPAGEDHGPIRDVPHPNPAGGDLSAAAGKGQHHTHACPLKRSTAPILIRVPCLFQFRHYKPPPTFGRARGGGHRAANGGKKQQPNEVSLPPPPVVKPPNPVVRMPEDAIPEIVPMPSEDQLDQENQAPNVPRVNKHLAVEQNEPQSKKESWSPQPLHHDGKPVGTESLGNSFQVCVSSIQLTLFLLFLI